MGPPDTERWFVKRGVPHFIAAYSASEDVLTRAVPVLTLVFLFSSISAIDLDWPAWGMVLATVAGLGVLLSAWMAVNRLRNRPPLAPPNRIGRVEVGVFLLLPAALPLLFGGDVSGAGLTLAVQLAALVVVYGATSYGLVSIGVWAIGQLLRTLGQTFRLFTRSLPLLLIGFMFLFVNTEAWQSAGRLDRPLLVAVILLFSVLAGVFLLTQIPRELRGLNEFESWDQISRWAGEAPVSTVEPDGAGPPTTPPLTRREKGNLWLVVFVSQGFRLALASFLVAAFFVGLGLLIIRPDVISQWTAEPPTALWTFTAFGTDLVLTTELVRVSAFLGAFAAVYFSVYTTTDHTLRSEFFEDTVAEVRQNLAVRAIYRSTA